jgi:heat shock protein HslJ
MKKVILVMPAITLLTCCSTFTFHNRNTNTGVKNSTPSTSAASSGNLDTASSESVVITGTQYLPIEGRSEFGTRHDLEGSWELDSLNGNLVPGKSSLNIEPQPSLPENKELRRDSTTTTTKTNNVTHSTTTVFIEKTGPAGNKITPPQGSNYHIPARPSINFFGANETFSGFTGCNKFSGRYSISGKDTISLQSAAASTKMVCIGDYDEVTFLNTLRRANSYRAVNGRLELLNGNEVLLVFNRKEH